MPTLSIFRPPIEMIDGPGTISIEIDEPAEPEPKEEKKEDSGDEDA